MKTKLCRKCGDEKSLDEFSRDKTHRDGRSCECKRCKKAYKKELKAWDPKRYLALAAGCRKRYGILHPERVKAQHEKAHKKRRDRDARDPEVIKARQEREARKIDRALHPEKYEALEREKAKAYQAKNRDKVNTQRRARYANNSEFRAKEIERNKNRQPQHHEAYIKRRDARSPEEIREEARASKAYRVKNSDKINAQQRARWASNAEKINARRKEEYYKRKAEQTGLMLLKAMDIIKDELAKDDHEAKLEKARANENARRAKDGARRAKKREKNKAYNAKNPEKSKELARAHYARNREKLLAKAQANRDKEPEKHRAYGRKYFHKRHGGMTKFMYVIAEILLTINLLKGIEDDKRTK